ncbi:hypothetical protein [Bradyrhizobium diazoefficiens]|uniref:hypothetical protein n=1 Tax=Bradyrhizobium diazoefficiens TaxID=1355477 RepID=UPI001FEFB227|nr:hypothetical protein [Bradyrhizobium diazoefficiens]
MTRLMITTDSSLAGAIQQAGLADLVIAIERRLVWGPLPSAAERDAFFAPRTTQPRGLHWLDVSLSMSFRVIRNATSGTCTDIGKPELCLMGLRGAKGQRCQGWMKVRFPWTCMTIQAASSDTSNPDCR